MSEKLSVEARAVMDLTSRENATYLDVLAAVTRMEAAAEERGRRAGIEEAAKIAETVAAEWRSYGYPKRHHGSCACLETAKRISALVPAQRVEPSMTLPLDRAQHVIGALERCVEHDGGEIAEAIVAELRERIDATLAPRDSGKEDRK